MRAKVPVAWLDRWMDRETLTYVLKFRLDGWMTPKKTRHSVEKYTVGWLDDPKKTGHSVEETPVGWLDGWIPKWSCLIYM